MRRPHEPSTTSAAASLILALTVVGCNQYEYFRVAGFAQESFSNDADILFVIDNSSSMEDEASALALNFDSFIRTLTDPSASGGTDGLADAVSDYIGYVQNRGQFLDYQLAITTTDVAGTYGELYGSPQILAKGDADVTEAFSENLLCSATCYSAAQMPSDPEYQCGEPIGEELTVQYLNCICGEDGWRDHCGSGDEEGLEAVLMAMCRAVEDPPAECYEHNQFTEADELSNAGLLRDDSTLIPVIVTDEGDNSRRLPQGSDDVSPYAEAFAKFGHRMSFAVIGPDHQVCNTAGATSWGIDRYQWFVDETAGSWLNIADRDGDTCVVADFGSSLEELGELLNSLLELFPLQSIPEVDTIVVFVDGQEVDRAEELPDPDSGDLEWTDGWSYLPAENAIEFHGAAVPDYNAQVRIYYRPLEGMPRELPF